MAGRRITKTDINHGVNWSQIGLTFFSYVHTALLVAWTVGGLLPGFSNGILHVPPLGWEILVLKFVTDTIRFNPCVISGKFAGDTDSKIKMIHVSYFLLGVAIIFNITHAVFTIIEIPTHATSLYWFLILFTIILFVLAILEASYIYYLSKFKKYILIFRSLNKID